MQNNAFLKGMCIGLAVGATLTATIAPIDKKKMMKSSAGKAIRAIGTAMDSLI